MSFKTFLTESINDKGIFKAIFIVGVPGAGKTFTLKKLSGAVSPRVVCTDIAAEYLSKKFKKPITTENWPDFEDKATHITRASLANYLNGVLPLFVDSTSNDMSQILHRAGILESLGYDVGMIFINTSLDTAIKRAKARAEKIHRHVDEDFIREVFEISVENKEYFKTKFSFFKEIRNDEHQLTNEVLHEAYKKVGKFFESEVLNPLGKRHLHEMKEKKQKYLSPEIISKESLEKKLSGWYK